jgi:hypothetical protein
LTVDRETLLGWRKVVSRYPDAVHIWLAIDEILMNPQNPQAGPFRDAMKRYDETHLTEH